MSFSLEFQRQETHLVLPRYSPYILSENIYDLLFQYVLTPEREALLKKFIQKLDNYTKSNPQAPFSISLSALEFLGEGWQELKLLNWTEIPVAVFSIHFTSDASPEEKEESLAELQHLMLMNYDEEQHLIYIYPRNMIW